MKAISCRHEHSHSLEADYARCDRCLGSDRAKVAVCTVGNECAKCVMVHNMAR